MNCTSARCLHVLTGVKEDRAGAEHFCRECGDMTHDECPCACQIGKCPSCGALIDLAEVST